MGDTPLALALVESFLNSLDVETGADDFDSVASYTRWLGRHDQPHTGATEADLALARHLRDALRAAAQAHHDGTDAPVATSVTDQIRLKARFGGADVGAAGVGAAGVGLESAEQGARTALGAVLAAVVLAAQDGSWQRLKICREDTCQWVFYDQSKNTSKQWCSMRVCGNRNKTRAYRSRQRS